MSFFSKILSIFSKTTSITTVVTDVNTLFATCAEATEAVSTTYAKSKADGDSKVEELKDCISVLSDYRTKLNSELDDVLTSLSSFGVETAKVQLVVDAIDNAISFIETVVDELSDSDSGE